MGRNDFLLEINPKNNYECCVVAFGHEKCEPNKNVIYTGKRKVFIIHYIINGKGKLYINGNEYLLGKDDIFVIFAAENATYVPDKNDPWEYIWFEFYGTSALHLCSSAKFQKNDMIYHAKSTKLLDILFSLLNYPASNLALELNCLSKIYKFFSVLIDERKSEIDNTVTKSIKKEDIVSKTIKFIEENYQNSELSVGNISKYIGVSSGYLYTIFKETTGEAISKYIIDLRIHKACEILAKENFTVKEIAYMTGYRDCHFFSRQFYQVMSVYPSEYRKLFRSKDDEKC